MMNKLIQLITFYTETLYIQQRLFKTNENYIKTAGTYLATIILYFLTPLHASSVSLLPTRFSPEFQLVICCLKQKQIHVCFLLCLRDR